MAIIKAYTDLEQSKKLSEILPLESADMRYHTISKYNPYPCDEIVYMIDFGKPSGDDIPCWSLAVLLDILPESICDNTYEYSQLEFSKISVAYHDINDRVKVGSIKDNLVDACYELILKLNELNLL